LYLLFDPSTGTLVPQHTGSAVGSGQLGIALTLKDNAPGGVEAQLESVTADIRSNGGGIGGLGVTITATENGFTSPTGPDTLTGQFSSNAAGNTSFTSSVFQGSSTLASVAGSATSSLFYVYGTYGVANVTTITGINPNSNITTTGESTVVDPPPPVPVPASLVMALSAVPAFGAFAWWKKPRRPTR
jgi:hypothetical protein